MPNVNDLANVAESLERSRIAVLKDNCIEVRNRNAHCHKCVDACPYECITVGVNELKLKPTNCVNCGVCTAVCPTEALRPLSPTDVELDAALDESTANCGGRAVVACARISSKHQADPSLYAEVPCLGRVSEGMLLDRFARGASEVLLVDGTCATCKYRFTDAYTETAVQTANVLSLAQGSALRVERASAFPDDMLIDDDSGLFGSSRRTLFSDTMRSARDLAVNAAETTIKEELGIKKAEPDIGERLRVSEDGALPRVAVPRHEALVNAMDALGSPEYDSVDTRDFGSVEIDTVKCNACGMCAVFCPTGAIKRDPLRESPTAPLKTLEFSAADCVQCNLCVDVCWKKCLAVSSDVKLADIFDFEPRVFNVQEDKRSKLY